MSNFSNSDHVTHADSAAQQNNAFFNDNAFGEIDGFLNTGAGDAFDQNWGFNPDQLTNSWNDAGNQQQAQTFRPGAQPDQVFSPSLANGPGNVSNVGYGGSNNAFPGYPQQQYNPSTITPSHLNPQTQQTQARTAGLGTGFQRTPQQNAGTIAPEALQSRPAAGSGAQTRPVNQQFAQSATFPRPASNIPVNLPTGIQAGKFTVIDAKALRQAANTRALTSFVEVGNEPIELPLVRSAIPSYQPRKSRNDIKRLLAGDSQLKAKLEKKMSKKSGVSGTKTIPSKLDASGRLTTQAKKEESSTSEDDSSDDSSDSESSDDESDKPPIPATRPVKAKEATRYDTVKSLWRPRDVTVSGDSIREGLGEFHELISTIKDRWKSDMNSLKEAEEAKKNSELPLLRERVQSQRDMLVVALKAAVDFGHPTLLDHFGASLPVLGTLALFLQDRFREADYTGTLVRNITRFLARCKLMDKAMLERSKLAKLLQRFSLRGDETVKGIVKEIENNAAVATKKKNEASKVPTANKTAKSDNAAQSGGSSSASALTAGVKRQRSADSASEQPSKKVASKPGEVSNVKKSGSTSGAVQKASTSTTNKSGSNPVVAKSSSFISSMQSAKRPAAAKPTNGPAKAAPSKPPEPKPAADQPFSFKSVLADVTGKKDNKPQEKRQNEKQLDETPEQRAKRIRKESRRRLRVSFKPEESLVEVRIFEHDPDEELGHDASQMRDVTDVGSEGKMFKLHQQHHEMMDIEDDDDEEFEPQEPERTWRTWTIPKGIDFSNMGDDAKRDNYRPHGGGSNEPECPEKAAQEAREQNVLLAVYSSPADIPSSPSEPEEFADDMEVDTKPFGELAADHDTTKRLEEVKKIEPVQTLPNAGAPPVDMSSILSILSGGPPPPPQMLPPQNYQQPDPTLAHLLHQMPNLNLPNAPPPAAMSQQGQPDLSAVLGVLNQTPQQAQPSQQQSADITSILASLQQPNQQQPQTDTQVPAPFPGMANTPGMPQMGQDMNLWNMMSQAHQYASQGMPNMSNMWPQQQQPQQQSNQAYENQQPSRRHEQDDGSKKQNKGENPAKFWTLPCKYYQMGTCQKGASCTYRHDNS